MLIGDTRVAAGNDVERDQWTLIVCCERDERCQVVCAAEHSKNMMYGVP